MQKVRLQLEYKCYPLWVYYDDGSDFGIELIPELVGNTQIDNLLTQIQDEYDGLFIDDGIEFRYVGFLNFKDKEQFYKKIVNVSMLIEKTIGTLYQYENRIELF